jgi:hypothetical protein
MRNKMSVRLLAYVSGTVNQEGHGEPYSEGEDALEIAVE